MILPHMISENLTKRPRSVQELAQELGLEEASARNYLRTLGQPEWSIVRPLDLNQDQWEISHDCLVPLLDSILARWSISLWHRTRPWLPWISAGLIGMAILAVSFMRPDPGLALTELGWKVEPAFKRALQLESPLDNPHFSESLPYLRRLPGPLSIKLVTNEYGLRQIRTPSALKALRDLKSLTMLDLDGTRVADLAPLRDLKGLTALYLGNTQVADLAPLYNLKRLTCLRHPSTITWSIVRQYPEGY
jgi:hypothetical protein